MINPEPLLDAPALVIFWFLAVGTVALAVFHTFTITRGEK